MMIPRYLLLVGGLLAAVGPSGAAAQTHTHTHATPSEDHHHHSRGYERGLRGDYTASEPRWWKGNTHTHSWWSDGDSPPEIAAAWYRENGYHFVVLSDHNIMQQGTLSRGELTRHPTFWYPIELEGRDAALAAYREHFGDDWVETRERDDGVTEVKVKALEEFRHLFEAAGEFIFVPGEEISASFRTHPVHINAVNIDEVIDPRDGDSVAEVLQNNLNAVWDHGVATGREVIAHVNHPNFVYAVTVEDLVALHHAEGEGFFELYNGHPLVENYGDGLRVGTERMWDIVLAKRLNDDRSMLYAVATDDAHDFALWQVGEHSNPGRGWVMVRARRLTPDAIVAAMKRGDFYNSTGVTLGEVRREGDTLSLAVEPEEGVEYTIEFIGTMNDVDLAGTPVQDVPDGIQGRVSNRYSEDIGVVFETIRGTEASYRLTGDELYVRARVTSSRPHPHGYRTGDVEMAWTQPLAPADRTPSR